MDRSIKEWSTTGVPDDFVLLAISDAEQAVFQNQNALGAIISGSKHKLRRLGAQPGVKGASFRGTLAALEFIVPFSNTPGAVLGRLIERTPIGLVSGVNGMRRLNAAVKNGVEPKIIAQMQRDAVTRFGRGVTGTAAGGGMFALVLGMKLGEKDLISGRFPDDSQERQKWLQSGKMEDAVKFGDDWFKLTGISPLGNLLAIGAQLAIDALNPNYTVSDRIAQTVAHGAETVLDQSFLRGTADRIDAVRYDRG